VHDQNVAAVANVFTGGSDSLDGGDGNDALIGDDNLLVKLAFTLPAGLAGDFERFTEGVTDAVDEIAHALLDLGGLDPYADIVFMGNDTIHGGNGNDLVVGDAFVVRTSEVTVVAGGSTRHFGKDDAWQNSDWKDERELDDHGWSWASDLRAGADTISGDSGADLIWGDNVALVSGRISRGAGLGNPDFDRARHEVRDGIDALTEVTDSARYWLAPQGACAHHYSLDNGDEISGGDGNDILFGQGGDDSLSGDAGNDWLVGGEGRDNLVGGPGADKIRSGSDSSNGLRNAVASVVIDWDGSFRNYGLKKTPFRGGGLHNPDFEFVVYDRVMGNHKDRE
jgi:Ca2+-binding RTX toxin-like protein